MKLLICSRFAGRAAIVHIGRTIVGNGLLQDALDFAQENLSLGRAEGVGGRQRMHAGAMQRLAAVDVPEARNPPLVHEQRFDLCPTLQNVTEFAN